MVKIYTYSPQNLFRFTKLKIKLNKKPKFFLRIIPTLIIFIWIIGFCWELILSLFPNSIYLLPFLKYNYSLVCHIETEKLFSIFGYNTLVCSRCVGIYFGSFFSSILIIARANRYISRKSFLLLSLPLLLDVTFTSLGIYGYSKIMALITGFLLGSAGFIYIHVEIFQLFKNRKAIS